MAKLGPFLSFFWTLVRLYALCVTAFRTRKSTLIFVCTQLHAVIESKSYRRGKKGHYKRLLYKHHHDPLCTQIRDKPEVKEVTDAC